jgi:hypothetical protein
MWPLKWIFVAAYLWAACAWNPVLSWEGGAQTLMTAGLVVATMLALRELWRLRFREARGAARVARWASFALLAVGGGTAVVRGLTVLHTPASLAGPRVVLNVHNTTDVSWRLCADGETCFRTERGFSSVRMPVALMTRGMLSARQGGRKVDVPCFVRAGCSAAIAITQDTVSCTERCSVAPADQ